MGRPTKLTPQVQEKIVSAMRAGNYFVAACRYAGISDGTGRKWMAWGDGRAYGEGGELPEDVEPYRAFRAAVREAEGAAEVELVAQIRSKVPDVPSVGLEVLSRRHPERWGRNRVEVEHSGGIEVEGNRIVEALSAYNEVIGKLSGGDTEAG
jgi:hypothetical protein